MIKLSMSKVNLNFANNNLNIFKNIYNNSNATRPLPNTYLKDL